MFILSSDASAETLRFSHQTYDASRTRTECSHVLNNPDSRDYTVNRIEARGIKTYRVHLWVTSYSHPTPPKLTLEILYWVTDLNHHVGGGTSTWINLTESTGVHSVQMGQAVENETAGLYLEWTFDRL